MVDYDKLKHYLITERGKELSALKDCFDVCIDTDDHATNKEVRRLANECIRNGGGTEALELYHKTLIYDGTIDFDCFMRATEFYRPLENQFWLPRRKILMPICQAFQQMENDELDELIISQPPRTGKTGITQFFMVWCMLRESERSNLYCTYSDTVAKTFYEGLLEIFTDPATYAWKDVFPAQKVAHTDAKDSRIDIDRRKHYSSFTGRSLYGSLNGTCDANGYQIMDDPHSGIEEAINKNRLDTAWQHAENDFMTRKSVDKIRRIWIGTRWSIYDCISRRLDSLQNDPEFDNVRWKEISIPALNKDDESNFEYDYGKGFSTKSYRQVRASFERNSDMASWSAQFQQLPIERNGAIFNPEDMLFYNGVLPDAIPDRVFMGIDPAWGGGDFVAAPVIFQYGDRLFVHDVVYTDCDKRISQPAIIHAVKKYGVQAMTVEATKMTEGYANDIDTALRAENIRINVMTRPAPTIKGKEQRIFDKAADIREHMIFLEDGKRSKDYVSFMQNVYSFTFNGVNKHDDAPDSLCISINMAFFGDSQVATVGKSPFAR